MPNFYSTLRRLALTTLLGGGGLLSAQAQLGQTVTAASNAAGTYTDLGTTGTVIATANTDDANSAAQNIGFTFGYNKLTFTQFVLNTNGVIRLGSAAPSTAALYLDTNTGSTATDPLQSTNAADVNLILPFNTDLVAGTGGAEYRVATTGSAGSRVCTIQWKNVADKAGAGTNTQQFSNFSFQVKLYESGRIEFVYGTATAGSAAANARDTDVGLKGSGIGTGQLLLATKASTDAWSAATFRSSNYGLNTFVVSKTPLPDAGRTFGFSDPSYCVAGAVTQYPYQQNFDGATAPALACGVTTINSNNDTGVWATYNGSDASSAPNAMRYNYSFANAADDWFFTQGLTMTVGQSYQLQFKYKSGSATYTEALEVKVGNAATVAAQTTTVFSNTAIKNTTYSTTGAGSGAGQVILFTPTTSGVYYFGFHAISIANQLNLFVDDLQVTEVPSPTCPQPTAVVVSNITTTGATVSFNGPTNGTAYSVVYVPRGTTPTATSPSVSTTTSSATLTGLNSNTNYDIYVLATCGTSGNSVLTGPTPFTTACAIVTNFPYTETFDGVTAPALPCGITVINTNNDTGVWVNNSGNGNTAPNAMRYNYSSTNAADDWFFTNGITMTVGQSYQLQFKYKTASTFYNEGLEVKVGNAATVAAQTTTVFSNTAIQGTSYVTTTAGTGPGQVVLFTPTTSGVYYFGFHAISISNQLNLFVDDLQVTQQVSPACPQPTAVQVGNITTTGATVTFTGPTNGTAYSVIYVPRGTTPTATSPSVTATTSPVTLTGLSSNTNYDIYVQATCGTSGNSVSSGPVALLTACAIATTFPYTENFDGVTAPALPCGITVINTNNDTGVWVNNSSSNGSSAPNAMRYNYSSTNAANDWFFTNGITMVAGGTYQLQFKYKSGSTFYNEGLEVKVGNAATVAAQTTTVFSNTAIQGTSYVTTTAGTGAGQVAGFTPTANGVYYFGFHAISVANQLNLYVDDLQVTVVSLASCPTPTNVAVNGITDTQAQVTFNGPSIGTSYTIIYVPRGTTPTATSPSITGTSSPITLTGLTPNTPYDIYVQGTCGSAGQGITTTAVGFTTACLTTATFPYTQNFDGVTAPALPCGITVLDANNDGSTWMNSNDQPSSGVNSMRYMPSAVNPADDWFFTNALRLSVGKSYQLKFKYRAFSYNYPEKLEIKIGTSTTPASQTTTLFSNNNIINNAYVTSASGNAAGQVINFTPTAAGIYFIGFHAISAVNSFSLYIDDLEVVEAPALATKSSVAPGFSAEASPVPFSDHLNLSLTTLKAGPLQLTLLDAVGRVVRETTTNVPAGASSLAVPQAGSLPAGMYILTVRQGGNTQVIRVAHE
ncbi:MAG TPA: fibronectin type III domain-containing protein [Hymenobacter sp.]|uniref:fibronectin type III domain-containing protein n=1 Tax=Hymenobacter sp. TaxID=1898978 RepID=UPI002D7EF2BD|nr:fibronectin type III domain-containing protein [Hymenobacter sp.]HET9505577.1 fibronectin type III domain-containing protein [Hymenobacter sp.]